MRRTHEDYLNDMAETISLIEEFTEGMSFEEFLSDRKTQFAVIRALEVIGEAAKAIPDEFKSAHPQLHWGEMARMRDKLIHAYFGVDLRVVWKMIKGDSLHLKETLSELL